MIIDPTGGLDSIVYILFLIMFVSLTMLGIFLRVKNKESALVLWAGLISICGGLTGLQVICETLLVPYVANHGSAEAVHMATWFTGILNFCINTFPYYGILVFFLIYNGLLIRHKWLIFALSGPVWFTLLLFTDLRINELNERFIGSWGIVYLFAAIILGIRPIIFEKERVERLHHVSIALVFLVPLLCLNVFHLTPAPYSDYLLIIIPILCLGSLFITLAAYLRGSFLGVKRRSLQTVHIGMTLVHHSLKNTIGKVKLNAHNIRASLENQRYEDIDQYVENLLGTYDKMMNTIAQISSATNDKPALSVDNHDLADILDEVLETVEIYPKVRIETRYDSLVVRVDRQLLAEAILNICSNAVEAMKEEGTLRIELEAGKRVAILSFSDTGSGMNPRQVQNAFEPFYTTKQRSGKHFGLGMYHVKKVVEAHKGKVLIRSKPGRGTTIMLILKKKNG